MDATALVIIDMQQGLFADRLPDDYAAVLQRLQQLYQAAHQAQRPVIFVCHEAPDSVLAYQSAGWQLVEGLLLGQSDLLVRKTTPDSFLRTDLHQLLQQRQINRLVIAGYASEFCVDTTVRSAAAHGYAIDLVADSHTTHDKPHLAAASIRAHHNATLAAVRSFGVPIRPVPAAEAVFVG
ncbi:MAG: cysteine hydrolase family protein [Chromatiaceae bacterium]